MNINVTYAVNLLAGTGRIKMEKQFARISIETDMSNEKAVYEEAMKKLSDMEALPKSEIKILSFSAFD